MTTKKKKPWEIQLETQFPELCSNIYCGASLPPGWHRLVEECLQDIRDLSNLLILTIRIDQIKAKFGQLVIYYQIRGLTHASNDQTRKLFRKLIQGLINLAITRARQVCMVCGEYASGDTEDYRTLCHDHTNVFHVYDNPPAKIEQTTQEGSAIGGKLGLNPKP